MIVKKYSEDPNKYWPMIERFRLQTFKEGNDSLTHKKYNVKKQKAFPSYNLRSVNSTADQPNPVLKPHTPSFLVFTR